MADKLKPTIVALGLLLTIYVPTTQAKEKPDVNYLRYCQGCHRADGSGSLTNDVPDLRASVGNFLHLKEGREFVIQVAGVAQAPISDIELAELMNWTLVKFSALELPDTFKPYEASEIAELRVNRPTNMGMIRNDLLKKLKKINKEISANEIN